MHTIEIKMKQCAEGAKTVTEAMAALNKLVKTGSLDWTIDLQLGKIDLRELEKAIEEAYRDGVRVKSGGQNGCYGARDGSYFSGLTVWLDPRLMPERFLDGDDGKEVVNLAVLMEEFGTRHDDIDGDSLLAAWDVMGLKYKSDNTYNYLGFHIEDPTALQHTNVHVHEGEERVTVIVEYHLGGDIRGNYSSALVYTFASIEDVYPALYPQCELTNEEGVV